MVGVAIHGDERGEKCFPHQVSVLLYDFYVYFLFYT